MDSGPLFALMGTLLETWEHRYAFRHNLRGNYILFDRDEVVARVDLVDEGHLHVTHQLGSRVPIAHTCTVDEAVLLVETLMSLEYKWPDV